MRNGAISEMTQRIKPPRMKRESVFPASFAKLTNRSESHPQEPQCQTQHQDYDFYANYPETSSQMHRRRVLGFTRAEYDRYVRRSRVNRARYEVELI
jgi:hypothetical protein